MAVEENTLAQIKTVLLEILDEFVRICEENSLTYFLAGGTLLGAVRHKGFIPWDDDIDVAMPRNDYEKLIDLFKEKINTNYYLLSYSVPYDKRNRLQQYAKLCKNGTIFAENNIHNPSGIFIDIWPVDNCVKLFLPLQNIFISLMWKLYCLKTHADIPKRRIKRYFANFICFFISLKFCKKLLKAAYSFFNNFQTKYITCFPGIYGREKETHKYDTIFPLSKVSFEGNNYWAPGNWDTYLKEKYDNYMELPPVEQQIAHQPNFISFGDGCINKEN